MATSSQLARPLWRCLSLSCLLAGSASAAQWAVIVAGSRGYMNYRHQADACHAYQVVRSKGIPEDNVILMAYDDIANDTENPFRGQLFNKPDPQGPGTDVYAGCKIDYSGHHVTPENFLGVLTGNATGKALRSTADDEVFLFFSDHGAPGLIAFPEDVLHKDQFQAALRQMHSTGRFKKLVIYLETCESGSMFQNMSTPGIYAVSAADPHESSWGAYCGSQALVNGKNLGTCLGDLFSVTWMEDSDMEDTTTESLEAQFNVIKARTNRSHVMQWGDLSFLSDHVSQFIGGGSGGRRPLVGAEGASGKSAVAVGAVSARRVDLDRLYTAYVGAETSRERVEASYRLDAELARQRAAELAYMRLAELAYPGDLAAQHGLRHRLEAPDHAECELAAHAAIRQGCASQFDANSGFALQFHQVVVNLCADVALGGLDLDVVSASRQACDVGGSSVAAAAGAEADIVV